MSMETVNGLIVYVAIRPGDDATEKAQEVIDAVDGVVPLPRQSIITLTTTSDTDESPVDAVKRASIRALQKQGLTRPPALQVDVDRHLTFWHGELLQVRPSVQKTIEWLVQHTGEAIATERMAGELYQSGEIYMVRQGVYRLRRHAPEVGDQLETIVGYGYRFFPSYSIEILDSTSQQTRMTVVN